MITNLDTKKLHKKLLGDAGEHYVAFELARRGISPAMLSTNTKGADLLATISGKRVVSIQVKSSRGANNPTSWEVGSNKPEISETFFYIFLNVWEDFFRPIEVFIVPSTNVVEKVNWDGVRPVFRINKNELDKYRNNWAQIAEKLSLL